MKTIMIAGFATAAGLALSAAEAQSDWTYVACEPEITFTMRWLSDNEPPRVETSRPRYTFRFNDTSFDMHTSGPLSWTPLCEPGEEVQSPSCTINADAVISRGMGRVPDMTITRNITLDRVSGRLSYLHLTEATYATFRHEGSGDCVPTTDPTAGQRRF